jgi:PKD repeat protein
MRLRELFKRKLENAEVIPGPSVEADLMRRLALREFLRFIPSRFNIYYLGGLAAAAIAAGLLIFSGAGNLNKKTPEKYYNGQDSSAFAGFINIPLGSPLTTNVDNRANTLSNSAVINAVKDQKPGTTSVFANKTGRRDTSKIVQAGGIKSFAKKGLFSDSSIDSKKLKSGYLSDGVLFEVSALSGCSPLKLHFINKVNSIDSCRWTFGDGGYSNQRNPDWIFDVEGEYKVVLQVFGHNGLQAASSVLITVYPKPKARFEISPEKAVLPDDEITFLNYSSNAVRFVWNFGDGNHSELFEPKHRYTRFDNYNVGLVAYSESGCSDSLVVKNAFSDSEYFIRFPNAFIPNPGGSTGGLYSSKSDEVAQVFHPVFSGVADYQLKIFSKLGVLIFESNDVNIGWDGYFKGQLCNSGVYIWKIRGTFINGEPFVNMGDVTLLKN